MTGERSDGLIRAGAYQSGATENLPCPSCMVKVGCFPWITYQVLSHHRKLATAILSNPAI